MIKLLEETVGNLHDLAFGIDFLNMTSKAQARKTETSGQPQKEKRENTQIYAIRNQRGKVTTNTQI